MKELVLGIGGNQGNRLESLRSCREIIEKQIGKIVHSSSLVESEPWGFASRNWFLNQILIVDCGWEASVVLSKIQDIERQLGRIREGFYADRPADIDILFFGDEIINAPGLQIPHPHLHMRRFVMMPLAEVLPEKQHPVLHRSNLELLNDCPDTGICRWFKQA